MEEVFQELSGFLCSALSPRIRCRPAQSAKLYSLSKDLAGRNPQSSCNFDSFNEAGITHEEDHVVLIDLLLLRSIVCCQTISGTQFLMLSVPQPHSV